MSTREIVVLPFLVGLVMEDGTEPLYDETYRRQRLGELDLITFPGRLPIGTNTRALQFESGQDWPSRVVAAAFFDDRVSHRSRIVFELGHSKQIRKGDTLGFAIGTIDINGYVVTRWRHELTLP